MKIRESLRVVGLVAVLALVCASLSQWSSGVHAQKQEKARSAHPISTKTEAKTTLDEAPKLFQLATLCTLVAWLGGRLVVAGSLDRREALFLLLALACLLILSRAAARASAMRLAPTERCLFIGDERSAEMVRAKLSGHGGINARVVAHVKRVIVAEKAKRSCRRVDRERDQRQHQAGEQLASHQEGS